jgi:activating signal cointegrator 1
MKILSLWDPWGSFMALGYKKWETRGRVINYRGPLAIHVAKNKSAIKDGTPAELAENIFEDTGVRIEVPTTWPYGCIIAVVDVFDCVKTEDARPGPMEANLGNYMPKRFAWMTRNLRMVKPFPFKGSQGLKPLPPEVEKALEYV